MNKYVEEQLKKELRELEARVAELEAEARAREEEQG